MRLWEKIWLDALGLVLLAGLCCVVTATPARAQAATLSGKRVLFLGDSITQGGGYVTFVEYYLDKLYPAQRFDIISIGLSSETVSGLTESAPIPAAVAPRAAVGRPRRRQAGHHVRLLWHERRHLPPAKPRAHRGLPERHP